MRGLGHLPFPRAPPHLLCLGLVQVACGWESTDLPSVRGLQIRPCLCSGGGWALSPGFQCPGHVCSRLAPLEPFVVGREGWVCCVYVICHIVTQQCSGEACCQGERLLPQGLFDVPSSNTSSLCVWICGLCSEMLCVPRAAEPLLLKDLCTVPGCWSAYCEFLAEIHPLFHLHT